MNSILAAHPQRPLDQLPRVAPVGPDQAQLRVQGARLAHYQLRPIPILNVGRMHDHAQQQADRINQQVPLDPLDLLARVETLAATGPCALGRLAVDDAGGGLLIAALGLADPAAEGVVSWAAHSPG